VKDHDFPGPDVPHAHPYGIYDLKRNEGFVNTSPRIFFALPLPFVPASFNLGSIAQTKKAGNSAHIWQSGDEVLKNRPAAARALTGPVPDWPAKSPRRLI
jgi:hypothetical protein